MAQAREDTGPQEVARVEKPWGFEVQWAASERYVGRLLHIRGGERLSLHFHRFKDETLHVLSGHVVLVVREDTRLRRRTLGAGDTYRIPPHTLHRLEALAESEVLEVATPHFDDAIRLEDDYGRAERRPSADRIPAPEAESAGTP